MEKHTKGPWFVEGTYVYGGPDIDHTQWKAIVADVRSGDESHPIARHGIGAAEADRNASLIAAAPELAEALRDLASWVMLLRANPWSPLHKGETEVRVQDARAALAKAGRS